jgi:signal transduction histidine kinase/DNA-binding NarL/FixJ family response regulator
MNDPRLTPKVLYIEDNADTRALVRRVLSRDFIILEASDPISGIELAVDTNPDLVLSDINLPQMSGREVAARLKTLLPNVPLVAVSANQEEDARQKIIAAGFVGFIPKPIEIDTFADQVKEFLGGKRETIDNPSRYQEEFASELVERIEEHVRELSKTADRNEFLNEQNRRMIIILQRRQRLLEAGARVGQVITSILDLDELLNVTAKVICEEYGFADASIYLLGNKTQSAIDPLISAAINDREAKVKTTSPSAMALPLMVNDTAIGALAVRSTIEEPLTEDDHTALQSLANQTAIAINNAKLLHDLQAANQELLRSKTFEAVATATGEAIHWVGNKAAPIPASAKRVRDDLIEIATLFKALMTLPPAERESHAGWIAAQAIFDLIDQPGWKRALTESILPLGIESTLEDLQIIEQSAATILNIKEDLIGPARMRRVSQIDLAELIKQNIFEMGLPDGVVSIACDPNLPQIEGDARQLGQVFNNLAKNAWEALIETPNPKITISARLSDDARMIIAAVADNGPGIPPEIIEKIWLSFFTTKGGRGGTGLGLSACMAIVSQMNGKIGVESKPGEGTVFTVTLPVGK